VEWNERVYGALLVAVLTVLAGFYAWRQASLLRRLRGPHGLSAEEARWRRGQAWRRLFGSALMLALAALLAWAVLVVGERAQGLADTPEGHHFMRLYTSVWIVFLILLLALVILAAVDVWFTRRFSLRQQRKILADRRAMLEREVARLRQGRNGHG
jgi:heme/copper-type cytochrome/quinol oxidase subunit 2